MSGRRPLVDVVIEKALVCSVVAWVIGGGGVIFASSERWDERWFWVAICGFGSMIVLIIIGQAIRRDGSSRRDSTMVVLPPDGADLGIRFDGPHGEARYHPEFDSRIRRASDNPVKRLAIQQLGPRAVAPEEWAAIPAVAAPKGDGYRAYLQTEAWKRRRTLVLRAYGYRCAVCNGARTVQVHHRTYQRAGNEAFHDLVPLCRDCHEVFHARRGLGVQ